MPGSADSTPRLTRRELVRRGGRGAALLTVPGLLAACAEDDEAATTVRAPTSTQAQTTRRPTRGVRPLLEELRAAYLEKGANVDRFLRPGLSRAAVRARTRKLGFSLPDEVFELYGWRDGQPDDAEYEPEAFHFRDNVFVSLERALVEYEKIRQFWGDWNAKPDVVPLGFDPKRVFPFAAFEGDSYSVVCAPHDLETPSPHPVVSFFEGVYVYFSSIESMLATCVEWVRHPAWSIESPLYRPEGVELRIWRRHNPGLPADAVAQED